MHSQMRYYHAIASPFDPCPPKLLKSYIIPPNVTFGYQPANLQQYSPMEALKCGVLWPALLSPYEKGQEKRQ